MIFPIIILAVSLSIDALGVGIVYGLRKITIPFASKLIICFFSIFYAGAALLIGKSLSSVLTPFMSKLLGVAILAFIGIWIVIQNLLRNENKDEVESSYTCEEKTLARIAIKSLGVTIQVVKNPTRGDIDKSGIIDKTESFLLGFALSVDAIGVGIGSALAGFSSSVIPFAVGLFQLGFLYLGTYLGKRFSSSKMASGKIFSLLPGLLLIFLAVIRIC